MKDQPNSISFSLVKYRKPFVSSLDAASATSSTDSSTSHSSSCSNSEVENILNTILPPKEFEEDGLVWKQQVSSKETVRKDVESLKGALDNLLIERQARDTGICQVRRELYAQCFDELIRQTTITCIERGLLLLRVRDEARMTLHAYMTLYESSTALGFKKSNNVEAGKEDMVRKIDNLVERNNKLKHEINNLRFKIQMTERKSKENREIDKKFKKEELNFFRRTNQQLKSQIEAIMTPGK